MQHNGGTFCWKKYKIITDTQDMEDVLSKLIPVSIINGDVYTTIIELTEKISQLTPSTTTGYYSEKILQILTASGAAIVTLGAGGDMIVNLIFTIKNGLVFISKIIQLIDEVIGTVTTQNNGEKVIDPDAIKLISNLFAINFEDGVTGVECWVRAIMKNAKTEGNYLFICDLLQRVYPSMVDFIANMIGTMIPDAGVFVKEAIVYMMKKETGKRIIIGQIIRLLIKNYNKIPRKYRKMIERPDDFEKMMTTEYKTLQKILYDTFGDINNTQYTERENKRGENIEHENEQVENIDVEHENEQEVNSDIEQNTIQEGGLFPISIAQRVGKHIGSRIGKEAARIVGRTTGLDNVIIEQMTNLNNAAEYIMSNAKLIAYILHKMTALSFAILYILKECPMN